MNRPMQTKAPTENYSGPSGELIAQAIMRNLAWHVPPGGEGYEQLLRIEQYLSETYTDKSTGQAPAEVVNDCVRAIRRAEEITGLPSPALTGTAQRFIDSMYGLFDA